jgi:hypothetical protein
MTDTGPFANWPNLDKRPTERRTKEARILPGSTEANDDIMASNNSLENFLGGSPFNVFVRLVFISLVVGALLMWLELRPIDILHGVQRFIDRIYAMGFDAVRNIVEYVAAGAVIVVPIWFVLRLLSVGGKR